jgi:hypothetical protein
LKNQPVTATLQTIALLLIAILMLWVVVVIRRTSSADKRHGFRMTGGRAGVIEYRHDGRLAHLPWEMVCGDKDIAIAINHSEWISPEPRLLTVEERSEAVQRLEAWARAKRIKCEIDAPRHP